MVFQRQVVEVSVIAVTDKGTTKLPMEQLGSLQIQESKYIWRHEKCYRVCLVLLSPIVVRCFAIVTFLYTMGLSFLLVRQNEGLSSLQH